MNRDVFEGLDDQQASAVRHRDGPALIVAGAGSGKTTVLVRRTAHLVMSGVDPSRILLLTFTRASAKSILDRARSYLPEAGNVHGGTFHSVAARLIRENHALFGLPPGFTVLDPGDVEDVIKRIAADRPVQGMAPRASTIAKIVSFAHNTKRPIPEVVERRFTQWAQWSDHISEVAAGYADTKKRHHILDFDDLLRYWAAMANHPVAGPLLRERFRYVMVDEHQDSNRLQLEIIYGLGGDAPNVLAVGDPAQSIYSFRGAEPDTLFDFRRRWPDTRVYLIETNYRSTPEIVAAADRVDRAMAERFDRSLRAAKEPSGRKPALVHVQDQAGEGAWIAESILKRRDAGVGLRKQAVLVRQIRVARHVEFELTARGIPYVFLGGMRIHETAHVKDVLSVLRIAVNPADQPAWMRFLTILPRVGEKKAAAIAAEVTGLSDARDAIKVLEEMALKRTELARCIPPLKAAVETASAATAMAGVRMAMDSLLADRYEDDWDWRKRDIDAVVDLAAAHPDLEEFLRTVTIDVSVDKKTDPRKSQFDEEGAVTVATMHSSKGLEWDVVYIPSFIEGTIPSLYTDGHAGDEEEKRIFYVAVTRARKELNLMRPASLTVKGQPMLASESQFERIVRAAVEPLHPPKQAPAGSLALATDVLIAV